MIEPTPPRPGEPLRASWAQRLVAYVRSLRVSAGPGLVARRTPSGTVVSLAATARRSTPVPPVSVECCPAVVERPYDRVPGSYVVALHPQGMGGYSTVTALLFATERGRELDLPAGTVVLAHRVAISACEDGDDGED